MGMKISWVLVFLCLLIPSLVLADASICTVTTQIRTPDGDSLAGATVIFELYGITTAIDTNLSVAVAPKRIITTTDADGYVSIGLRHNEYMIKQKTGAVTPWTRVTVIHSTLTAPFTRYFTIDVDSTGTFSFGVHSDAVQFSAP